jgi:hypothetical protein
MAATHPDISHLTEVEVLAHRGPETTALATGRAAHCPDTLEEKRWPEYAQAALAYGVRCFVTLAHQPGPEAVTSVAVRGQARVLDPGQIPLAELLVAAGGALVDNLSRSAMPAGPRSNSATPPSPGRWWTRRRAS